MAQALLQPVVTALKQRNSTFAPVFTGCFHGNGHLLAQVETALTSTDGGSEITHFPVRVETASTKILYGSTRHFASSTRARAVDAPRLAPTTGGGQGGLREIFPASATRETG